MAGRAKVNLGNNVPQFDEAVALRSQNATLEPGRGRHRKYLPFVFTEQGVAMLSSVLNSERAIRVNIEVWGASVNQHMPGREDVQEQE
jgi:hypothetical protein